VIRSGGGAWAAIRSQVGLPYLIVLALVGTIGVIYAGTKVLGGGDEAAPASPGPTTEPVAASAELAVEDPGASPQAGGLEGARGDPFTSSADGGSAGASGGGSNGDSGDSDSAGGATSGGSEAGETSDGSASGGGIGGTTGAGDYSASSPVVGASGTTSDGEASGSGSGGGGGGRWTYAISVRTAGEGHRSYQKNAPPLTPLPGERLPLAVFLGVDAKSEKLASFSISPDVRVNGDGYCRPRPSACRILEMRDGGSTRLRYLNSNGSERTMTLELVAIERVRAKGSAVAVGGGS
jgi:hypothetical protein